MADCPWPNGPLLNCRKHFNWLRDNALVEGDTYETAVLTQRGHFLVSHPNCAVVLQSLDRSRPYTKQYIRGQDGTPQFVESKMAFYHNVHLAWFNSADSIYDVLTVLQDLPDFCLVRGSLIEGAGLCRINRRQYAGSDDARTSPFIDVARSWLCIDLDDLAYGVPDHSIRGQYEHSDRTRTGEKHPLKAGLALIDQIAPDEFRCVRSVIQLSSSTGLKRLGLGIKCGIHWWVILEQPMLTSRANEWARGQISVSASVLDMQGEAGPFRPDQALYSSNQVHYVARPILPDDTPDIERLAKVTLEDHFAQQMGFDQPRPKDSVLIPDDVFDEEFEFTGRGMTADQKRAYIRDITTGASIYKAYMKLSKSMFWHNVPFAEVETYIRGLIELCPKSHNRRDDYLKGLHKDLKRLADQTARSKRNLERKPTRRNTNISGG